MAPSTSSVSDNAFDVYPVTTKMSIKKFLESKKVTFAKGEGGNLLS